MIGTVQGIVGAPVELSGYAQNFGGAVTAVEFSGDEGVSWTCCATDGARDDVNVNWRFAFTPQKPGTYRILVRAVDASGRRTPEPAAVTIVADEKAA